MGLKVPPSVSFEAWLTQKHVMNRFIIKRSEITVKITLLQTVSLILSCDLWPHLDQFGEGLVDEDEGDEEGEDLLSETGHETNQDASLEGHSEDNDQHQPETNPHPARQILDPVDSAELHKHTTSVQNYTNTHQVGFREQLTSLLTRYFLLQQHFQYLRYLCSLKKRRKSQNKVHLVFPKLWTEMQQSKSGHLLIERL